MHVKRYEYLQVSEDSTTYCKCTIVITMAWTGFRCIQYAFIGGDKDMFDLVVVIIIEFIL